MHRPNNGSNFPNCMYEYSSCDSEYHLLLLAPNAWKANRSGNDSNNMQ
ncbi:hypothetical protein [Candidatus Avelusimicrobium alvi]